MCRHQFKFRNQLAINVAKILLARKDVMMGQEAVDCAFDIADAVVARIKADAEKLNAELAAAAKAEFEVVLSQLNPIPDSCKAEFDAVLAKFGAEPVDPAKSAVMNLDALFAAFEADLLKNAKR